MRWTSTRSSDASSCARCNSVSSFVICASEVRIDVRMRAAASDPSTRPSAFGSRALAAASLARTARSNWIASLRSLVASAGSASRWALARRMRSASGRLVVVAADLTIGGSGEPVSASGRLEGLRGGRAAERAAISR
eukprot:scaffold88175_cov26-Tisochrysis_lutea.AAC.1